MKKILFLLAMMAAVIATEAKDTTSIMITYTYDVAYQNFIGNVASVSQIDGITVNAKFPNSFNFRD